MKNKVGSLQLEFHKGILWIVDCGRVDNGSQTCGAGGAFHHYVEVRSKLFMSSTVLTLVRHSLRLGLCHCGFSGPQKLKQKKRKLSIFPGLK